MTRTFNWGHGIAAVYALFAAATLGVVIFAINRPVDLVSPDYYARSLAIDARQAATARAAAFAHAIGVTLEPPSSLAITLPAALRGDAAGEVRLYRPARAGDDRSWPLRLDVNGRHAVSIVNVPSGQWVLELEWTSGGVPYYLERRVTLP